MTEKLQDMENEAMSKIVELEKQLMQRNKDLESIRVRLLNSHIQLPLTGYKRCHLKVLEVPSALNRFQNP